MTNDIILINLQYKPTFPNLAQDFIEAVNKFSSIHEAYEILKNHSCKEIKEHDSWNDGLIQRQGEYYFTCNASALIAFEAGVQHNGGIW